MAAPTGNPENQHTGPVHGHVVQARDISGGIHVHHQPAPDRIVPQQLPGITWHFTGRTTELAELTKAADAAGTVVLSPTEPIGGIGTTALAVRWARESAERFPDGTLYMNLRGSDPHAGRSVTPDQVVRGFLDAVGVAVPPDVDAQFGTYRSVLAARRMLLLLDDARDAAQVLPLLPGDTRCLVLVTSRRPLPDLVATAGGRPVTVPPLPEDDARDLLRRHVGEDRLTAEPAAVAGLVAGSGGVPLALNVLAAHAAARPDVPLATIVDQLRAERKWLRVTGSSLATRTRVIYSWAQQRADTGPVPKPTWSVDAQILVVLATVALAVIAGFISSSIQGIQQAGIVGVLYLLLRIGVLAGAWVLVRSPKWWPVGAGFAAAMAVYLLGDAVSDVTNRQGFLPVLYLLATLAYIGIVILVFRSFHEIRWKLRFVPPGRRPLALAVLAGVLAQFVLLFIDVPAECADGLGNLTPCTFTVTGANGALGMLLFVLPIAALCVLVALTEPLTGPRRIFVIATVLAYFVPELYQMLASLLLGGTFTYVGDDVYTQHIGSVWYVLVNAAVFAVIAGGTVLLVLNRGVRAR